MRLKHSLARARRRQGGGGGGNTVAGAPTIGVASAGNGTVTITFTAPASNGGSAITGYIATLSTGATQSGSASPITFTGVTNGTPVTVTVKAINGVGQSASSAASNSVTPSVSATVPDAPTIGTATAGNGTVTITFTAPSNNGGSAIINYTATLSTGATASATGSPIVFTGVTNGTPVTVTVKANNGVGASLASAASNSVTPTAVYNQFMFATQWNVQNNIKESQGKAGYISRYAHYIGSKPVKKLKFLFPHYHVGSSSTGLATSPTNDLPIVDMSVEYNGVTYPVTFSGGSRSYRVTDGTNGYSDEIDIQATMGISELPVNALIYTKMRVLLDSTANGIPTSAPRGTTTISGQQVVFYNPANVVMGGTDTAGLYTWSYQNGGTLSADTSARTSGFCPFVLGVHTSAPDVWLAFGDSMTANTGDTGTNTSGTGWFQRALGMFTVKSAGFNFSVHGSTGRAGLDDPRITDLFAYCNLGVAFKGANDFSLSGNSIAPQAMIDRMLVFKTKANAAGITKVGICKTCPRTTSTDNWVTEENQTPVSGWDTVDSYPLVYNTMLASSGFDFVIPFDSIRGTTSVFKFKPNKAYDSTHINQSGNIDMATEALPIMQAQMLR